MSKASDKRFDAIQAVNDAVVTVGENKTGQVWRTTNRTEIAAMIRELSSLGRTERWTAAIEQWARMVEDYSDDFQWAFFQGSIWAGHAA